jgi:hypothetical protein
MLRILLIFSLVFYILYKMGFFRGLFEGMQNPNQRVNNRPPNSNVDVDGPTPKQRKRTDFKGGDYIDYEDVK